MATGTHILGRGIACTLGVGVEICLDNLRQGPSQPQRIHSTPELSWPYFPIPDSPHAVPDASWHERARALVRQVVAECGADINRDAPLFIASSSLNVGGLEAGAAFPPDQQAFVEEVAAWLDWRGPVFYVASACTSSLNALLSARALIGSGLFEHALVLGIELRNQYTSAGFSGMQLLAPDIPRPLGLARDGLVLGEAVAALYLGSRPARWRVQGGANRTNGNNPVGADRYVVAHVITQALAASGVTPDQIGLVKLQASGSPQNDAEEIAGLHRVFPSLPPLVTFKAALGHTLGASGAAELILLTACLETGTWPNATAQAADPQLNAQCSAALPVSPKTILFNIQGFGGGHACLVIEDAACR